MRVFAGKLNGINVGDKFIEGKFTNNRKIRIDEMEGMYFKFRFYVDGMLVLDSIFRLYEKENGVGIYSYKKDKIEVYDSGLEFGELVENWYEDRVWVVDYDYSGQ